MRLLLNFSALKKGGGQNVALNFLNTFLSKNYDFEVFFVCAEGTQIETLLLKSQMRDRVLSLSQNPLKRIWEEMTIASRFCIKNRIDIIYSYFGFGLYPKSIPQVMGSADSNLFFPDINFWSQYKGLKLLAKKIIDKYRVYGLKRCDGIILETELLEKRCNELYHVKAITRTIKPSINVSFDKEELNVLEAKTCPRALLLCGWQLNKNIMLIPEIAMMIKEAGIPFQFVITAQIDGSQIQRDFDVKVKKLKVDDYVKVIGVIDKKYLASLYEQIDFVLLLSKLESFSNNIIEAWTYKRVLVVADEPWARNICKEGAYYVNRDNAIEIGSSLINLSGDKKKYDYILNCGNKILNTYPTIEERTKQEIDFIKLIYERKN